MRFSGLNPVTTFTPMTSREGIEQSGRFLAREKSTRSWLMLPLILLRILPKFRSMQGFENKRINLTLLFGPQTKWWSTGEPRVAAAAAAAAATSAPVSAVPESTPSVWDAVPRALPEVQPEHAGTVWYCL